MTHMVFSSSRAEGLLREWYRLIDAKEPFDTLAKMIDDKCFCVRFPNNPLDYEGFRAWYLDQCENYTGTHHIHSITVSDCGDTVELLAVITWSALRPDGSRLTLYPDVTMKLSKASEKFIYYGCVDRLVDN